VYASHLALAGWQTETGCLDGVIAVLLFFFFFFFVFFPSTGVVSEFVLGAHHREIPLLRLAGLSTGFLFLAVLSFRHLLGEAVVTVSHDFSFSFFFSFQMCKSVLLPGLSGTSPAIQCPRASLPSRPTRVVAWLPPKPPGGIFASPTSSMPQATAAHASSQNFVLGFRIW
jgi:hypothetical protein